MILYAFECNKCDNKITTREPESKHESILDELKWEYFPGLNTHTCRECRPKSTQKCDNDCGTTIKYNTTGKQNKKDQLEDEGWINDQEKWFCCDECHRESIF